MTKALALLAFEALSARLAGATPRTVAQIQEAINDQADYPAEAPLFVTWTINGDLRGCIGTFASHKTAENVSHFAVVSALQDSRFPPVKAAELPRLAVSITVLDNFTPIEDALDWKIGKHGLKVLFSRGMSQYLGTFLPSVAEEQGWTQEETLWHLLSKAGLPGVKRSDTLDFYKTAMNKGTMDLVRYDGLKSLALYEEYAKIQ